MNLVITRNIDFFLKFVLLTRFHASLAPLHTRSQKTCAQNESPRSGARSGPDNNDLFICGCLPIAATVDVLGFLVQIFSTRDSIAEKRWDDRKTGTDFGQSEIWA